MSGFDRLREVAAKATPGPWFVDDTYGTVTAEPYRSARDAYWRDYSLEDEPWVIPESMDSGVSGSNLDYIAAASPDAVLGLLDRLEAAEAAVARVRAVLRRLDDRVEAAGFDPLDALSLEGVVDAERFGYLDGLRSATTAATIALDGGPELPPRTHKTAPVSDLGPESGQGDHRDDEGRSGARDGSGS